MYPMQDKFLPTTFVCLSSCRTNVILGVIESGKLADDKEKTLETAKEEALALRALCHFDLVITYGLPYTGRLLLCSYGSNDACFKAKSNFECRRFEGNACIKRKYRTRKFFGI